MDNKSNTSLSCIIATTLFVISGVMTVFSVILELFKNTNIEYVNYPLFIFIMFSSGLYLTIVNNIKLRNMLTNKNNKFIRLLVSNELPSKEQFMIIIGELLQIVSILLFINISLLNVSKENYLCLIIFLIGFELSDQGKSRVEKSNRIN